MRYEVNVTTVKDVRYEMWVSAGSDYNAIRCADTVWTDGLRYYVESGVLKIIPPHCISEIYVHTEPIEAENMEGKRKLVMRLEEVSDVLS